MEHPEKFVQGAENSAQPRSFMSLGMDQPLQEMLLSMSAARFQARHFSFSFRVALPDGTTSSLIRESTEPA